MRLYVRDVAVFARAVNDDKQIAATVNKHEVVHNTALVIEQQTVALFAHRQVHDVCWYKGLE